ncbi:MAG: hypothetical protein KDC38_21860, partial [Planctomycetes bacterium]|nr:hypothetical protein [Planctomycetota bacterium]
FETPEIDTIVLLSDGCPSKAGHKWKELIEKILVDVPKWNALPKIEIDTFGFEGEGELPPGQQRGKPDPEDPKPEDLIAFLKKLAEDSGGKYTPVP